MSATKPEKNRDDSAAPNFIADIIDDALSANELTRVVTRFPPEPNGFLHVGHAKAIFLNFAMADKGQGSFCNLRLDDTNPEAEDDKYVRAIQEDIEWLGCDPGERVYFASNYFDKLYAAAVSLVEKGLAYVDSQSPEEIRENRGNFYKEGLDSPYRNRSVSENLDLLQAMREGRLDEGAAVLRAKIDMRHKNLNMRDPLMYRIRKAAPHRTGETWKIYPMYDFAHPLSDAFEGITHSLCTLEFEAHRPLYEWFVENLDSPDTKPRQIEFARLNIGYTVLSKRKLHELVEGGHVEDWDDPRMPTIAGMRRRGYLPESLQAFCERIGVAKKDSVVDVALLEHRLREDLNAHAQRTMAVLRPLKVTITNIAPEERYEFEVPVHPEYEELGKRTVTLSRDIWVEQDDYMEVPIKKWFRLAPGKEVRLRGACLLTCDEVIHDENGQAIELRCSWDPESKGGTAPDGRRVKGTLHWISEEDSTSATVRLYDRLYTEEEPNSHEDSSHLDFLNPDSLETITEAKVHKELAAEAPGHRVQFERLGYFCVDQSSTQDEPIFNRTIGLRDSWAKLAKK
ncbi:MAG: glutamine--tRNA ligase/YqeY domain fusion protein [Polyangiaceae bacterium]|nr:glutamine--tRNA ligase/YqeY domain fusion protein [Polyangiaceae bacterium]